MEIWSSFRKEAEKLLKEAGYEGMIEDAKEEFGDFTFPCFSLAKERKESPVDIAKDIVEKMEKSEYFEKIENVGPYVNFHINPKKMVREVIEAVRNGSLFKFESKGSAIVEHTSANPTGPLHVGRTRNSIIGDTLARILRRYGYDVKVHYFVNDVGKQVATLLWGAKNISLEEGEEREDYRYVKYYQKAYELLEKNPEIEKEVQDIIWRYERGDAELREMANKYIGGIMRGI